MPGNEWKVAPAGSLLPGAERRTEDAEDSHVEMDGAIPVYKLHGSLNWSRVGDELELFQDLRPAFRHGGDAAIVPPVPEKEIPAWLRPVWSSAEAELGALSSWR